MTRLGTHVARIGRRRVVLGCLGVASIVLVAAIALLVTRGGDGEPAEPALASTTSTTTPPDSTGPGEPVIVGFDVPRLVRCDQATVISVSWATSGAVGVQIGIDSPGAFGYYPPSGHVELPFPCDRDAHSYRLVALGSTGLTTSRTVEARVAGA